MSRSMQHHISVDENATAHPATPPNLRYWPDWHPTSAAMSLAFLPYLASRGQHAHTRGLRQVIFLPVSDIVIIFPTSRLIVSMPNRRDFIHPHTTRLFSLYRSYHGHLDAVDKYLVVGGKWYLLGKNGGSINWSLEALPSPAAQWSVQPLRSWANEEDRTNRRL